MGEGGGGRRLFEGGGGAAYSKFWSIDGRLLKGALTRGGEGG